MIKVLLEIVKHLLPSLCFQIEMLIKRFHFFIGLDLNNIETHSFCQLPLINNQLFLIILIDL